MKAAVYNRAKGTPELVEVPVPEILKGKLCTGRHKQKRSE